MEPGEAEAIIKTYHAVLHAIDDLDMLLAPKKLTVSPKVLIEDARDAVESALEQLITIRCVNDYEDSLQRKAASDAR